MSRTDVFRRFVLLTIVYMFAVSGSRTFYGPLKAGPAETIRLSAGTELGAEISNYSLVKDEFCFTITNTSIIPSALYAIGFQLGDLVTAINLVGPEHFAILNSDEDGRFEGRPFSFALVADKGEDIDPAIRSGNSATFCVDAKSATVTADEVARSIIVLFRGEAFLLSDMGVTVSGFSSGEFCFSVLNETKAVITSVGFARPECLLGQTSFDFLSSTPFPQPGSQNLAFSQSPGHVPQFAQAVLSFAMLSGRTFAGGNPHSGIPPGAQSSSFCVRPRPLAFTEIYIRLKALHGNPDGVVIVLNLGCAGQVPGEECSPFTCPGGGGLTGILGGRDL